MTSLPFKILMRFIKYATEGKYIFKSRLTLQYLQLNKIRCQILAKHRKTSISDQDLTGRKQDCAKENMNSFCQNISINKQKIIEI